MKPSYDSQKILAELENEFIRRKSKNPSFSKRRFANQLGLSSGALTELMNGKRPLTPKTVLGLSEKLGLPLVAAPVVRRKSRVLSLDLYEYISGIEHYLLLNLPRLKNFKPQEDWIVKKIGSAPDSVRKALARLEKLGLIRKTASFSWTRLAASLDTPADIKSLAIQKAHREALSRAELALSTQSPEERDFSFVVMAASPEEVSEIRQKIRQFQDELLQKSDRSAPSDLYQLSVQFIRLTKKEESL